jgi:hypothetical protein
MTRGYLTRTAQFVATGVAVLALAGFAATTAYGSSHLDGAKRHHHPYGMVKGKLVREGGPIGPGGQQPKEVPIRGLVKFTAAHHHHMVVRVRVGRHGKFLVQLPSGRYNVVGRSPGLEAGGPHQQAWCSQPLTVTVHPHRTAKITLVCPVP